MFTIALVGLTFPFLVMATMEGLPNTGLSWWASSGIVAAWCVRALSFCAQDWWVGMMQSTIHAMQDGKSDVATAPRRQWLLEALLLVACTTCVAGTFIAGSHIARWGVDEQFLLIVGLVAPLVAAMTIAGEWLDRRCAVQLAAMAKAFRSREEQ